MKPSFKLIGAVTLGKRFAKASVGLNRDLAKAVARSTILVERRSRENSPVDTGRLRASHIRKITPTQGTVTPTANYAIYVHEGTSRMRARPFLKKALIDSTPEIKREFAKVGKKVENVIDRGY